MKYEVSFTLPGLPKTTNSGGRTHWAVKVKEANHWKGMVALVARSLKGKPAAPIKKASLTLTRFSASSPDFDGLVSSFKHVVDGLVEAGILENDKVENVGQPSYRWEKAPPGKGYVKVEVREL